jgi:hypothetical protein
MSRLSLAHSVDVESVQCAGCGSIFGVPTLLLSEFRKSHRNFYCPIGCSNHYPGESSEEKAKRLLSEECARHQRTIARANAAEQEMERMKKRAKSGVCPCCNRTFLKLAYHIKAKHPEYAK